LPAAPAPALDAIIDAHGLAFRYPGARSKAAVGPLDLHVAPGELVGILGPNGAGKSTLLRLLAGILAPAEGTLRVLDHVIAAGSQPTLPRALLRRIGYAADDAPHFDRLSARENATFFARAAGMADGDANAAVDALFERLALAADADRLAGAYSYGMRRKLLLTGVLAPAPSLVLLDEPTLGLDPPSRQSVLALLRERAAAGDACVIATNDVGAGPACDRVLFLRAGVPVVEGDPAALIAGLGGETAILVTLDEGAEPVPLDVEGVRLIRAEGDALELASARGSGALPDVCAALVGRGHAIRAIDVRPPDLRDVYTRATGEPWTTAERP
jgi:ABC-2 type transport system ATP-binding protein